MKRTKNYSNVHLAGLSFGALRNSQRCRLDRSRRIVRLAPGFVIGRREIIQFCRWIGLLGACCRKCCLGTTLFTVGGSPLQEYFDGIG